MQIATATSTTHLANLWEEISKCLCKNQGQQSLVHLQVPQREEPKWKPNIKIDLPKFQGSLNPKEFVDWLNQIESIFEYYEVQDSNKVRLVFIKLRGRTSTWWEQLQVQRVRRVKERFENGSNEAEIAKAISAFQPYASYLQKWFLADQEW